MKNNYTEQKHELMFDMAAGITYVDAYLRYSSKNQDDGVSIEMQTDAINAYCARNNLVVRKWYIDTATSASKKAAETRAAFYDLLQDISGGVSAKNLIVFATSRAFRNAYESHKYRKLLRDHGVRLMSVTQHIDEETSSGRLTTSILSDIDQYKSEEMSDFSMATIRALVKRGFYVGNAVPVGYKTVPALDDEGKPRKKYAIDESTAHIVREMFDKYVSGYSTRQIADWMTSQGLLTSRGNVYSPDTILKILSNDFYIGTRRVKLKDQEEEMVLEDAVEPIIDKALFALAQQTKKDRKNSRAPKSKWRENLYLLTGKIICMECAARGEERYMTGKKSSTTKRGKKYVYNRYTCPNQSKYKTCNCKHILKEQLENYVLEQVKEKILNENIISAIADEVMLSVKKLSRPLGDEKALKKRKSAVLEQLVSLAKMKAAKEIDDEVYALTKKDYDDEKAQIDLELHAIEQNKKHNVTRESIEETIRAMIADIKTGNEEVIKTVFDRIVDRIEIDNDKVVVYLVIAFSPFAHNRAISNSKYAISAKINRSELQ